MEEGKHKRSLKSLLIRPKQQIRLTFAMLSTGIFSMALLTGYLVYMFSKELSVLQSSEPRLAVFMQYSFGPILNIMIVCQLLLWILSVSIGVWIAHRVYGPLVPLKRHVRSLCEGDFSSRVNLRKGDDMEEIAKDLNELAAILQKKASQ